MLEDLSFTVPGDSGIDLPVRAWRVSGHGEGPRVHLQAGVHADEIAGMLVLHRLLPKLLAAAEAGRLRGTVTVVPQANPFGLGQFRQGRILGRFHEGTNRNFNRGFVESAATECPVVNLSRWQKCLVALALQSELVLDLHTDDEAVPYLYLHEDSWPDGRDLVEAMAADLAILWSGDSDGAFEEAIVEAWLADGGLHGRLAATLELRGQADVDEALAERDVEGLLEFLRRRGVLDEPPASVDWQGRVARMGQMETLFAPAPGVLVFHKALGEAVRAGECLARIVVRPGDPASELEVVAPQDGVLVTRYRDRLVQQGVVVAKLACEGPSSTWAGGVLDP